jgi:predicted transposase YdaD
VGSDKLLGEYSVHFPNPLALFIQAAIDDYEAKSLTFKEIEKRADIFLIGRSGRNVVLVETQGYDDKKLFYSMAQKLLLFCTQFDCHGNIDAVAIFLDESHYRVAAEFFEQQFGTLLKFSPRVFVFSRTKVDDLRRLDDVRLIPLYPLCDITPEEITQQAPVWANVIKNAPELTADERKNLLSFLGGAISRRIKTTTEEVISQLFGGFTMEDTPIVQQIVERVEKRGIEKGIEKGIERGIEKGIPLGIQQVLLKLIAARFGTVPEDIRQKIQASNDSANLEQMATLLLTIQSMDELKDLVN